jgi:DMSO/TMAO reductase YedYZ heme-binding membrane subunit
VHYIWLVKLDTRNPFIYAAVLALLLGYRIWAAIAARRGRERVKGRRQDREVGKQKAERTVNVSII